MVYTIIQYLVENQDNLITIYGLSRIQLGIIV